MLSMALFGNTGQFAVLGAIVMIVPFGIVGLAYLVSLRDPMECLSYRQRSALLWSFLLWVVAVAVVIRVGSHRFHEILTTLYALGCLLTGLVGAMMVATKNSYDKYGKLVR